MRAPTFTPSVTAVDQPAWAVGARWSIPTLTAAVVLARRRTRLQDNTDGHMFTAIARNLRCCLSLSSPTDQYWIRLSPARTFAVMPSIPVSDVGPVYPVLAAIVPGPLDATFLAINVVACAAVLGVLAAVIARATGSVIAAVAGSALLVVGPIQTGLFAHATFANFAGDHGYDVFAAALLAGAISCLADHPGHPPRLRRATILLTLASLTRYALVAVPLSFVVLGVVGHRHGRSAAAVRRAGAVAACISLAWQYALYPLVYGSAPKAFAYHRSSARGVLRVVLGWFGADGLVDRHVLLAASLFVALFAALGMIIVRRLPTSAAALLATSVVAVSATIVAGQAFLVSDILLNDERHYLPVRLCLMTLVVCEAHRALTRAMWPRRLAIGVTLGVFALLAIRSSSPLPDPLQPRARVDTVQSALRRWPDVLVMSDESTAMLALYDRPALSMITATESTTGRVHDPVADLVDLASGDGAPNELLVIELAPGWRQTLWLPDVACVAVRSAVTDESARVRIALVDISGCAADP